MRRQRADLLAPLNQYFSSPAGEAAVQHPDSLRVACPSPAWAGICLTDLIITLRKVGERYLSIGFPQWEAPRIFLC
jgi:hypothetical protein